MRFSRLIKLFPDRRARLRYLAWGIFTVLAWAILGAPWWALVFGCGIIAAEVILRPSRQTIKALEPKDPPMLPEPRARGLCGILKTDPLGIVFIQLQGDSVILSGKVASEEAKQEAEKMVRSCFGLTIRNDIEISEIAHVAQKKDTETQKI